MKLPKELTTVTPLSKAVALLMFISLPIITFFFGMSYQSRSPTPEPVACTLEAKICPDGSAVGRGGPNCEFEECPSTQASSFTCPKNGWINCMPILTDEAKKNCSKEAVEWYKTNCPNFEGVAQ